MANVQTKIYAQLFCAWAESNFLKVIHTPHGYTLDEIRQVKAAWDKKGITAGWIKAVELGLRKIPSSKSSFRPNANQKLRRVIDAYVSDPSILRNKIAHGQWIVALNRANTSVNTSLTKNLTDLDVVCVDIWFGCHKKLAVIVESLIESPEKTFMKNYWPQLTELESFIEDSGKWTLQDKIAELKKKPKTFRQ